MKPAPARAQTTSRKTRRIAGLSQALAGTATQPKHPRRSMVRKGSTVRVRQRALRKPPANQRVFASPGLWQEATDFAAGSSPGPLGFAERTMASLTQRPENGRWRVRWRADGHRFGRDFATRADAETFIKQLPDLPTPAPRQDLDHLARYVIDDEIGCWDWQGPVNPKGYGKIGRTSAHRAFYEAHVGPIPPQAQIDHLCRNRRCVNPEHLEAVTAATNVRRSAVAKLDVGDAHMIRLHAMNGRSVASLARKYGVQPDMPRGGVSRQRRNACSALMKLLNQLKTQHSLIRRPSLLTRARPSCPQSHQRQDLRVGKMSSKPVRVQQLDRGRGSRSAHPAPGGYESGADRPRRYDSRRWASRPWMTGPGTRSGKWPGSQPSISPSWPGT